MTFFYMILTIIIGSAVSLAAAALLFRTKKRRQQALLIALPFGAGALLAAAFFDLLPESFELGDPHQLVLWTLAGFLAFFLLERLAGWFHHHHEHTAEQKNSSQRNLIVFGDIMHNAIDGVAIGAAFLVSPATGIITTIAVSVHEIPKELGTFALLMTRGWRDRTVLLANVATAVATLVAASVVFMLGSSNVLPLGPILALTAGFFIYIAASDIIPDIHEQPRGKGTLQAVVLVAAVVLVGGLVMALHQNLDHAHDSPAGYERVEEHSEEDGHHDEEERHR